MNKAILILAILAFSLAPAALSSPLKGSEDKDRELASINLGTLLGGLLGGKKNTTNTTTTTPSNNTTAPVTNNTNSNNNTTAFPSKNTTAPVTNNTSSNNTSSTPATNNTSNNNTTTAPVANNTNGSNNTSSAPNNTTTVPVTNNTSSNNNTTAAPSNNTTNNNTTTTPIANNTNSSNNTATPVSNITQPSNTTDSDSEEEPETSPTNTTSPTNATNTTNTTTSVTPPTPVKYAKNDVYMPNFKSDCLRVHNEQRAKVGQGNVTWSDSLAASAQAWAEDMAKNGFRHSGKTGENIASTSYSTSTLGRLLGMWVHEQDHYIVGCKYPKCSTTSAEVGHYTQMVWHSTTQVGCGFAPGYNRGYNYLCCQYYKAGNIVGQYVY